MMLKELQKKFVILTTAISIGVMVVIAIAINVTNYYSVLTNADSVLSLLLESDMEINTNPHPPERFPREIAFTTRFFVVRSNEEDVIDFIDIKNISSISYEEASQYVEKVNSSNEMNGTVDDFRFLKTENTTGYTYVFLYIEEEILAFQEYLYLSILILLGAIVIIFILACMLSRRVVVPIVEGYEKQKGFITDVSHEFKTPLAIIKADCDVLEIDNGECEWTDSIKGQVKRLNTLVEDLVTLTKLDEQVEIVKLEFSLSEVLLATINDFSSAVKKSELNIVADIEASIFYVGDEAYIRKLFAILIENALKYSEKGTELKIGLQIKNHKKIFTIENRCEEVSIGTHKEWFERFYRADKSRSTKIKGYGIGLSVAKRISDLHGSKISAISQTGREIIITVIF